MVRCSRCGRFTSRNGRVWVFSSRPRILDEDRRTWGPGFDPIHFACLGRGKKGVTHDA